MYYTNAHVFNVAYEDPDVRGLLNRADVLICEGWGGRFGGAIAGAPLPEQLATMDWMDDFLERLAGRGGAIHLVGDEPGVARACAERMLQRHPGLRVTGTQHGFWDRTGAEDVRVVTDIAAAGPDVLMVGLGSPAQERWIESHLEDLDVPLVLALGAMFRWYSGVEGRAPAWMRRLHLEWLLRLLKHPVRHFRRYVVGNPRFVWRCLRQRVRTRRSRGR